MNRIKRCITVTMFLALATNICANYKMSKSGRESIKKYENDSIGLSNGEKIFMAKERYNEFVKEYMRYLRNGGTAGV